jgi:hypothetical protein
MRRHSNNTMMVDELIRQNEDFPGVRPLIGDLA